MGQHGTDAALFTEIGYVLNDGGAPRAEGHFQQQIAGFPVAELFQIVLIDQSGAVGHLGGKAEPGDGNWLVPGCHVFHEALICLFPPEDEAADGLGRVKVRGGGNATDALGVALPQHPEGFMAGLAAVVHVGQNVAMEIVPLGGCMHGGGSFLGGWVFGAGRGRTGYHRTIPYFFSSFTRFRPIAAAESPSCFPVRSLK